MAMTGLIDNADSKLLKQRGFQALHDQMTLNLKISAVKEKIIKLLFQRFAFLLMVEEFFSEKLKINTKFTAPEKILNNQYVFMKTDYALKEVKKMHETKMNSFMTLFVYANLCKGLGRDLTMQ